MMESDHNWTSSNWSPMTNKKEPNLLTVMRAIKRFFGTNFWTNLRKKMDKTQNGTFSPWMLIKNCARPLILHTCKSDLGRWQVELWSIVNHYGCHNGCLVARGHRTETPIYSLLKCGCAQRSVIVILLTELNQLEIWTTDLGDAYLEAYTQEMLYIIVGSELGQGRDTCS